jgi:hypothetical protein
VETSAPLMTLAQAQGARLTIHMIRAVLALAPRDVISRADHQPTASGLAVP